MPTYTKIEPIPAPDMKMFENFEKFLQQSAKDHAYAVEITRVSDDKDKTE